MRSNKIFSNSFFGLLIFLSTLVLAIQPLMADELPAYKRTIGVSGTLNSVGSDTLNNLMSLWAEGFRKFYPNVKIQIEGKGSSTAPTALIEAVAQLGPMSRGMKRSEEEAFEKKFGYKPQKYSVAIDSLAVYIHKSNPLTGLTLQQVDAIFSKTRKGGAEKSIETWGDIGLTGSWAKRPISLYGRNSASGTYGFFKDEALFGGDFKDTVKEQPGSATVVSGVGGDLSGIGYSGIGYKTSDVKIVPIGKNDGGEKFDATFANALNGNYPLGRSLYIYVNQEPGKKPSKLVAEFLKFIFSQEGQAVVLKDGYGKLPARAVEAQVARLNDDK